MTDLAIDVRGLRKSYPDVEAVRGIDLQVPTGQVFALLGPNGAGKTTTVEILEGHRDRTAGEVSILGHDPGRRERAFKQRIGIVLQTTGVEPYLTVEEAIDLYRGYYPTPRPLDELVQVVGLEEKRTSLVRKLSGGQQRRLDVAIGLAGDPDLLFLDEPTTGFDPSARRNAWEMIKSLQSLGKTVFLTTHYLDEAQYLADRVAIIVAGRIVAQGAPADLARGDATTAITFRLPQGDRELPEAIRAAAKLDDGQVTIETSQPTQTLYQLTAWATEQSIELEELAISRTSLEDVYLKLTKEAEAEAGET